MNFCDTWISAFAEACKLRDGMEKALGVWKELVLKSPENSVKYLEDAFEAKQTVTLDDLESQISFWKASLRQRLSKNESIDAVCSALSSALGGHLQLCQTAADRDSNKHGAVELWKSILQELDATSPYVVRIADIVEVAVKSWSDACTTDLPRMKDIWNEAIGFWEPILVQLPESPSVKTKLESARDLSGFLKEDSKTGFAP
jgi:hypothetical protein